MEHGKILGFVALDLSTAFDTVDHDLLLQILHDNFGIEDKALCWFEMYLRLQSFKVLVNDKYLTEKDLTFSVPQGSCASAFIFISYSSVLKDSCPENISLNGFADDHSIMKAFKPALQNEKETLSDLNNCMANIKNMMDSVQLKMNCDKTEFIYFGNKQQLKKVTINELDVNGDTVARTDQIKFLGGYVDVNLTLKKHINIKCRTAPTDWNKIKSIRNVLTQEATQTLVLGLCISHLD